MEGKPLPAARPTMKDVALASGVSPATVSFVLNASSNQTIPASTRERVQRAADELGYVPHGVARALREGTSRIVILNVARLPHGSTSLASFIGGLDAELERFDYALLVRYRGQRDDVDRLVAAISPRAVLDLDRLYFEADPTVADGGWINGLAAHTAVQIRFLVERGHKGIAMAVPDDPLQRIAAVRVEYAREVVHDLGLRELAVLTVGRSSQLDGLALQELRQQQPQITAIAGLDDEAALRVLAAARTLGVSVPGDLAVIGFDDTTLGELYSPALTTVHVDATAFGRRAAHILLDRTPGEEAPGPATVIVRESA
jgi:DNA-binding LacI/PurR family transcriptional regulator